VTARTPSQRGAYSRNKGADAERVLCRWLRSNGYPDAERGVITGFRTPERVSEDPGDVRGTPICWSVKNCRTERISAWMEELAVMAPGLEVPRLLVVRRAGHADPGRWWCWLRLDVLADLMAAHAPADVIWVAGPPVRMELGDVVRLLRQVGYGEAP
jgi:hypothetical protein